MKIKQFKSIFFLILGIGIFSISCEKKKIEPIANSGPPLAFCTDCHKATFPQYSTDGHIKHTEGIYSFACSTCHFGHGEGTKTHQNSEIDVAFDPGGKATRNGKDSNSPAFDEATMQCSNVYCHSNGITADRGKDSTYTWGTLPFGTVKYSTTPRWDNGKIDSCTFCHNGSGNMTSDYLISRPNDLTSSNYPASGGHQIAAHQDNDMVFSSPTYYSAPYWGGVQCFWCHSPDDESPIDGPILQGTYGSDKHVDGETFFKPTNVNYKGPNGDSLSFYGGSMAKGQRYSSNGLKHHCGESHKCWNVN